MVQKESDFAIYENRVLYATLVYLKDFVTSRLATIKEATNTYLVKQHIKKLIDMGSRKINVSLTFDERRANDPLLSDRNTEKDVIDRLDQILTGVLALLKTPLMREVSKVEMVSRPISKTNILKMNRNFRESLACFDYIANYQGDGFTIEHIEKSLIPYTKQMNEAYTENLILLSFLNYMYSNNLSEELKKDYEDILKQREIQKENEILAKLRNFHATAKTNEQTVNEYLIMFEQGYRILEERNDILTAQVKEMEAKHQKELMDQQRKHEAFVDDLKEKHEEDIAQLNAENNAKLVELEKEFNQQVVEIRSAAADEVRQMKEEAALVIKERQAEADQELENYKRSFDEHIADLENKTKEAESHFQEQNDKIAALETEVLALRRAKGDTKEIDYTSEDAFDRLEQLKTDFDAFFERAWKEAKKQIRKDTLRRKKK